MTQPTDRPRPHRRSPAVLVPLLVFAVALGISLAKSSTTGFNPDESRWISRAHYLSALADPFGPVWRDSYRTRGQPPVGSYLTGLGLVLQGRDLQTNGPWNFSWHGDAGWQKNIDRGNMPDPADLAAARRFSALLIALSALALWATGRTIAGRACGAAAGLAFAVHPFSSYLGSLATSDAAFTLLIALATLAAARLALRPTLWRGLLVGALLGLGAGAKLSPLLAAVPLGALGALMLLDDAARRRAFPRDRLGWALALVPATAAAVFVGAYPYFWPDPVGRVRNLFAFRVREMATQSADWPTMAVPTRAEALRRVALNFTERYSILGGLASGIEPAIGRRLPVLPLELAAAIGGALLWGASAWRQGLRSPAALAFVALGGQVAVTIAGMRSEFDRYHAPMALFGALAFGWLVQFALPIARMAASRLRSPGAPEGQPRSGGA